MLIVVLESPSNIRAAYHPYIFVHVPFIPPSHQLHASSCTQPCMPVFIFWIAYLSSQNTEKYMYSLKIPIPHPFFLSTATQYFWPGVTSHQPLFDIYHNQLQRLFPLSCLFLLRLPGYTHILVPSKDDVKPIKQASQIPMFNIFERFQRVPQQSERTYLKETQLKCKPETCTVKRDPFTFIW